MSKPAGWAARRAAASTTIAGNILFPHGRFSICLIGLAVLAAKPALADTGRRALHIVCSSKNDTVVVEPFIVWNNNYVHNGRNIAALRDRQAISIGESRYTIAEKAYPAPVHTGCTTPTRAIAIRIERGRLLISEKSAGKTQYIYAELKNGIGAAWDVAGPSYRVQSSKLASWQTCTEACVAKMPKANPPPAISSDEDWTK